MDIVQTNSHTQDNYILKSNLWKFIKALRAQANPIYCLLVASPISYAWITIFDRSDSTSQKRIPIAHFVNTRTKQPSVGKYYQLNIALWSKSQGKHLFEVTDRHHLSVEGVREIFHAMVGYHCAEAVQRGERFELTPQIIHHYRFKARYIEEMKAIVEQCNNAIAKQSI